MQLGAGLNAQHAAFVGMPGTMAFALNAKVAIIAESYMLHMQSRQAAGRG
jgi:hypothetical protein